MAGAGSLLAIIVLGIALRTNVIKLPITRQIHAQYVADFSNDKILVGASHNVFVGKVIKKIGEKNRGIGPETQFAVEIIYNIKGNLQGIAKINQEGGYENGILYLMYDGDSLLPEANGGDALLEEGATYLFTSRYSKVENWYTIISHPNARKLISQDKNLSNIQLLDLAKNDQRVKELQEAYKNEILLEADVLNNNTFNSVERK